MWHTAPPVKPLQDFPRYEVPSRLPPGTDVGHIEIVRYGHSILLPARIPGTVGPGRRARSDQYAFCIDGEWLRMSYREAALQAVAQLPRELTRRELASSLQNAAEE
jgi:hypothetical protein